VLLEPLVTGQAGKLPLDPCRRRQCIAAFVQAWLVHVDREIQVRPGSSALHQRRQCIAALEKLRSGPVHVALQTYMVITHDQHR